jgi:hypothetical protein
MRNAAETPVTATTIVSATDRASETPRFGLVLGRVSVGRIASFRGTHPRRSSSLRYGELGMVFSEASLHVLGGCAV